MFDPATKAEFERRQANGEQFRLPNKYELAKAVAWKLKEIAQERRRRRILRRIAKGLPANAPLKNKIQVLLI